jgi:hypothetical protein
LRQDFEISKEDLYNEIALMKVDHKVVTDESMKVLARFDQIDWGKSEEIVTTAVQELTFSYVNEMKYFKQKSTDLEAKYESVVIWVNMVTKINERLKEDI